jgi:hypothetical protein
MQVDQPLITDPTTQLPSSLLAAVPIVITHAGELAMITDTKLPVFIAVQKNYDLAASEGRPWTITWNVDPAGQNRGVLKVPCDCKAIENMNAVKEEAEDPSTEVRLQLGSLSLEQLRELENIASNTHVLSQDKSHRKHILWIGEVLQSAAECGLLAHDAILECITKAIAMTW